MYNQMIRETLATRGLIGRYDARHIEAAMRTRHGTLDAMSAHEFGKAVTLATADVDDEGADVYEQVAQMEGL